MELSKKSEIPRAMLARYESDSNKPTKANREKLNKALGVTEDYWNTNETQLVSVKRHEFDSKAFARKLKTISKFDEDQKQAIEGVLDYILKSQKVELAYDKFHELIKSRNF